jgi:hypothetical protein
LKLSPIPHYRLFEYICAAVSATLLEICILLVLDSAMQKCDFDAVLNTACTVFIILSFHLPTPPSLRHKVKWYRLHHSNIHGTKQKENNTDFKICFEEVIILSA